MSDTVMTPQHPRWEEFCERLEGPEACDFRDATNKLGFAWTCNHTHLFALDILFALGPVSGVSGPRESEAVRDATRAAVLHLVSSRVRAARMTDAITAYYIATVWMGTDDDDAVGKKAVIRMQACGPDDYRARVRALWPDRWVIIGPISVSKEQG
jgi:hypothetical protein